MSKLILDDDLRAKLNGLNETVEVCEPSGETVGQFVPQQSFLKLLASFERLMPLARPSNLTAPKMALEVFKSCDGTIGSVRKITLQAVERVLKDGGERVTFEILQGACQSFTRSRLVTAPRPS